MLSFAHFQFLEKVKKFYLASSFSHEKSGKCDSVAMLNVTLFKIWTFHFNGSIDEFKLLTQKINAFPN